MEMKTAGLMDVQMDDMKVESVVDLKGYLLELIKVYLSVVETALETVVSMAFEMDSGKAAS
jgi:hypothetical protein